MVAITVILAAMIASIVLGMATNIPVTRTLAVTVDAPDADHLVIVYKGGPDADSFSYAVVNVAPSSGGLPFYKNATHPGSNVIGGSVGSMVTVTAATSGGFAGKDHVIVTGRFKDGSSQIILNTFI